MLAACNSTEVTELTTSGDQAEAAIQTEAPTDSISFVAGQDMQSKRDRFGLLALNNGTLIAAGGREVGDHAGGSWVNRTAEVFDPIKSVWTFTGEMNEKRLSPVLFELPNGNVMIAGGLSGQLELLISTEIWDPATGTWTFGSEMNRGHNEMDSVTLNDGRFMIIGGTSKNEDGFQVSLSKETEIFDPESETWTDAAPMAEKRANHRAVVLNTGKVLVIGGGKWDGPYLKSVEIYDPNTDSWKYGAEMSKGRVAHTATLLSDGKVLVVGGKGKMTVAEIYDPNTDTWALAGETNKPRGEHAALLLDNGSVLVTGGIGYLSEAEIFNPKTSTWSIAGSLTIGRYRHAVTQLSDGRVLVMAGTSKDGMLAAVEIAN